jgi:hypothetical protein
MTLSAREERILGEIERDLTTAEPLLGRALCTMRMGLRTRMVIGKPAHRLTGRSASQGWVIAMIAGLLVGIALMSAGLVLDVLAMVIVGTALTQLSLVVGWLARALSTRQHAGR